MSQNTKVNLTRDEAGAILRELAELIAGLERIQNRLRTSLKGESDAAG